MRALSLLIRGLQNQNYTNRFKCLLLQLEVTKGSVFWYSDDKKKRGSLDPSKLKCKEVSKPLDSCVKADTIPLVSLKVIGKPVPKECEPAKVCPADDASVRPFVNPCPSYPPCDPAMQPVHPCRVKPERASGSSGKIKDELSMRTRKVLLALTSLISGAIIYKMWDSEEQQLAKGPKRPRCILRPQYIRRTPEYKEDLPKNAPYLIVGGGTAAFSAFRTIKSLDPTAKILIVSSEPYTPYMRPPLTKELLYSKERQLSRELRFKPEDKRAKRHVQARSIYFEPEEFFTPLADFDNETGGIAIAKGWTVQQIDPLKKIITLNEGAKISYGKCLLATGAAPKKLSVFENNSDDIGKKVTNFRTVYDYMEIEDVINCGGKQFAVIGDNSIATELACSLAARGLEVTQISEKDGIMKNLLPSYLSQWLSSKVEEAGVKLLTNIALEDAVVATNGKLQLITKERKRVTVDHAIVASGVIPNTSLAKSADLELDLVNGGFAVNSEMMIRTDLYAAGDCASFYDPNLGRRRLENHDHAIVSGRIAGENMTGKKTFFNKEPIFWSAITPDMEIEYLGIVDSSLPTVGVYLDKSSSTTKVDETSTNKKDAADDFSRGVLFYLKKDIVVGLVLWNLTNRSYVANSVLNSRLPYDKIDEAAKLFTLHRY